MLRFEPSSYGAVIADLLEVERLPALGPGTPNRAVRAQLDRATIDRLFAPDTPPQAVPAREAESRSDPGESRVAHTAIRDRTMAEACRSALWLYHDFLDESHTISQSIETTTGSYWHGIMHRREPDFSNAAYWFRRVGRHPVFPALAAAAREIAQQAESIERADWLRSIESWDPLAFIDLCETVYATPGPDHELCRRISLAEWQLLFDHSYRNATGA